MNTEEKARAYDEVLERAKKQRADYQKEFDKTNKSSQLAEVLRAGICALDMAFPELAESEDERIRKWIFNLVNNMSFENLTASEGAKNEAWKKKVLAYLEKQKDASKAIEAVDRIDKYIDERLANAHDMKDSNPDKKYYRGWDDALGKIAGILQDVYSNEKQKEHQNNNPSAPNESSWTGSISSSHKDKNLDEIAQDYVDGVKEYNPEPTWDLMQTAVCYGYHYCEQKEQKPIGTDFRTAVKNLMNLHKIKNKFT